MTTSALDYTRWVERPLGVTYRRWVIASTGLRHLFRTRFFRLLLVVAWGAGVAMAALGFGLSQSIASGGWLESLAGSLGPRPQAVMAAFSAFVLLYPDIVVAGLFTLIFYAQSFVGLGLSLVALTVLVPRLVTRDRASNALTIYLARPLTSVDYLVGKFGILVGVLLAVWTGPLLFGWALTVLLAPDRVFMFHSLAPLLRALSFNGISLVVLAAVAFGVSSATRTAAATTLLWIGLWIVLGMVAEIPVMPDWVQHASFSHDLRVIRNAVFSLDEALIQAGQSLPFLNRHLAQNLTQAGEQVRPQELAGAVTGLAVLMTLSSLVFLRRLRPE
jgi:ABC-2 type transport system permease protein